MTMHISLRPSQAWDRGLFLAALGLALMGGVAVASASATLNPMLAFRHGIWVAIGIVTSLWIARTNYRNWTDIAWLAYGLSIVLLALVPVAGAARLGATRWLSIFGLSIQPSEFGKLTTVWLLARYLAGAGSPLPRRALWMSLIIVGPPALLVFLQPDLGSASIFCAIWLGMIWVAGASRRTLGTLAGCLVALLPLAWHLLKGYQRDRLLAFLDPSADPLGVGYTMIQSTIAIGAGGLWGRGWLAGTQNRLSFLPERHSDFIFSVIGEERGMLGCFGVLGLFGLLLARTARLAMTSSDPQGRLLAAGIFSWLAYQACVNMGMVMGLLPVVGVPLPLVSYGGSSMVAVWIALGLLQSLHRAERSDATARNF
ncbi:MAG: rod shape-determining protein RodA [Candidatus Omnitrophica bacterium]|nr:rod shape-determining protein RodA [Candidatus Omnitrophota bacterium]